MQLKPREYKDPELSVGSFADIAFLLIIFFILTTTFAVPYGQQMQIPSGTQDPEQKTDKQLTISLKPGRILYGQKGVELTMEQLRSRLSDADLPNKPNKERIILLDCAERVAYEEYFQVAMTISKAGGVIGLVEEASGQAKDSSDSGAKAGASPAVEETQP